MNDREINRQAEVVGDLKDNGSIDLAAMEPTEEDGFPQSGPKLDEGFAGADPEGDLSEEPATDDQAANGGQSNESETESAALTWDFALTCDSTALNQITSIIVQDDGDLLGDSALHNEVEEYLEGEATFTSAKERLIAGRELLRVYYAKHNQAWSAVSGAFAGYATQIGKICNALKDQMKVCGEKWGPWAAKNLKFMSPRTRQTCMQLAKVEGIKNHLHFGKERLILLASALKGKQGDDPIGDFLQKYDLQYDPSAEIDLDAYKAAVDLALDHERIMKEDIKVGMQSLKKYRDDGHKVDAGLINTLHAIKSANGDLDKHLSDPPKKDDSANPTKKAKSFIKIATTLVGTINWITEHQEIISTIDEAKIDELTGSLANLKRLITQANAPQSRQ